jgi:hypothetical protein
MFDTGTMGEVFGFLGTGAAPGVACGDGVRYPAWTCADLHSGVRCFGWAGVRRGQVEQRREASLERKLGDEAADQG